MRDKIISRLHHIYLLIQPLFTLCSTLFLGRQKFPTLETLLRIISLSSWVVAAKHSTSGTVVQSLVYFAAKGLLTNLRIAPSNLEMMPSKAQGLYLDKSPRLKMFREKTAGTGDRKCFPRQDMVPIGNVDLVLLST